MIGSQAIFLLLASLYLPPYTTLLSWLTIGAHRLHPLLGGPARVAVEGDAWHQITTKGQDALPLGCLMLADKRESDVRMLSPFRQQALGILASIAI